MIINGFAATSSTTLLEKFPSYTVYPKISKFTIIIGVDFLVLALAKKSLSTVESLYVIDTPFHLNRCKIRLSDCVYIPPGRYVRTPLSLSKKDVVFKLEESFTKTIYIKAAKKLLKESVV